MMKTFVETERLLLREIVAADAEGLFRLDSDPEVHRYLGNKPVISIEQCYENIAFIRQQFAENGIGRWAVIEKATGEFVGWSGLKLIKNELNKHRDFYEIGYRFIKAHWGKGYATESARAALNYGFDVMALKQIYGMTTVDNAGSNHVLHKIGLHFVETFDYCDLPHNWYSS